MSKSLIQDMGVSKSSKAFAVGKAKVGTHREEFSPDADASHTIHTLETPFGMAK
jgi:hypothetical protein